MKQFPIILMLCVSGALFSQDQAAETKARKADSEKRAAVTMGFLQGGGSLIGADIEFLLTDRMGFQIGGGFIGFGGGLNLHFKPSTVSSFMSLQIWNQGIGDKFAQRVLSLNYVFRAKKILQCQIGLGRILETGRSYDGGDSDIILTYAIGLYKPL